MTGFLIDTHVLIWWAEARKLSHEARLAIAVGTNQLFFSHASLWELWIKIARGKLILPEPITNLMHHMRCHELPITIAHIETTATLPHHHHDPFDRLLIAQAKCENLTLITSDSEFFKYDIRYLAA